MKTTLHIGTGITDRIYAGRTRTNKQGFAIWTSKEDVTDDFWNTLIAIMSREENKKGLYLGTENNPKEYILKLEKMKEE